MEELFGVVFEEYFTTDEIGNERFIIDYIIFLNEEYDNIMILLRCFNHCPKGNDRSSIFLKELINNSLTYLNTSHVNMNVDSLLNLMKGNYGNYENSRCYCFGKFYFSKEDFSVLIDNYKNFIKIFRGRVLAYAIFPTDGNRRTTKVREP